MALKFYKQLYPENSRQLAIAPLRGYFSARSNSKLSQAPRPISIKEIHVALFNIAQIKAPSIDGFQANFFQKSWSMLKDSLVSFIRNAIEMGTLPQGFNDSLLALAPETPSPKNIKQF